MTKKNGTEKRPRQKIATLYQDKGSGLFYFDDFVKENFGDINFLRRALAQIMSDVEAAIFKAQLSESVAVHVKNQVNAIMEKNEPSIQLATSADLSALKVEKG